MHSYLSCLAQLKHLCRMVFQHQGLYPEIAGRKQKATLHPKPEDQLYMVSRSISAAAKRTTTYSPTLLFICGVERRKVASRDIIEI